MRWTYVASQYVLPFTGSRSTSSIHIRIATRIPASNRDFVKFIGLYAFCLIAGEQLDYQKISGTTRPEMAITAHLFLILSIMLPLIRTYLHHQHHGGGGGNLAGSSSSLYRGCGTTGCSHHRQYHNSCSSCPSRHRHQPLRTPNRCYSCRCCCCCIQCTSCRIINNDVVSSTLNIS